jgi:threonine/homoserine/homoserine lactone efflux protein
MTTAGLFIFVLGLLTLAMMWFLVLPFLSRSYQARNPGRDPSRHDRFQRIYALAFASFFLVTGVILFVAGLLTGGSVGFDL